MTSPTAPIGFSNFFVESFKSCFLVFLTVALSFGCAGVQKNSPAQSSAQNLSLKLFALTKDSQRPKPSKKCDPIKVAAFDVGSGSIKAIVAEQLDCGAQIGRVLYDSSVPVDFSKSLKDSLKISTAAENAGFEKLLKLKKEAEQHGPVYWVAVATQAFRQAENGSEIIQKWSRQLKLPIQILSQEEEALLAYQAVKKLTQEANLMVWDIGGGSQQIVWADQAQPIPQIFKSQLASVRFSEAIMELVKHDARSKSPTPNPLSKEEMDRSLKLASILAEQQIPRKLKDRISSGRLKVYGIGGVHGKSLLEQVGKRDLLSEEMLEQALFRQRGKTDAQIGGLYAATDVTNLILVLGFMKVMGLKSYRPIKMSLSEALILSSSAH